VASPTVATPIADQTNTDLAAVSLDVSDNFSDADVSDTLTYTIKSGLPIGTGFTIDSKTGVFSGTPSAADEAAAPLNVIIRCTDGSGNFNEVSAKFELPPSPTTEFVNSRNISGGVQTSAANWLHDPTYEHYLFARTVNTILFQPRDLWRPASRPRWVDEWEHINKINPICLTILHQAPMNNVPGFRVKRSEKWSPYTDYAMPTSSPLTRKEVMLSIDGTDNDLVQGNSQASTTNPSKQAGWHMRVTNDTFRSYLSDVAVDALAGTNRSGHDLGGGNMANFMVFWYDGIDINTPKSGASLRKEISSGTVDSILENKTSSPQQNRQIRIDTQPGFSTTGTLSQDSSYGETNDAHAIWLFPPTGTTGFIGYHVIGYKTSSGGKSDLYIKDLSKIAHDTQYHLPEAGWKYSLNTQDSGHSNPDWDGDGVNLDRYTVESWNHAAAVKDHFDQISDRMIIENGTNSMRCGNAFSSSNTVKRSSGLPHPSAYDNMWDIGHNESIDNNAKFSHETYDTSASVYDCSNTNIARGMRAISWCSNAIRDNQGGWMQDKPRGAMLEIDVYGNNSWDELGAIDASYARFYWALQLMVPNCFLCIRVADSTQRPCMLEEHFIDLNSNYSTPAAIGTYNPAGGGNGTHGHPVGSWTWATGGSGDLTDNGRQIYMRRVGNWLVAINTANAPSGYNTYAPTHLASGYSARDPEDLITASDFAQLVTDGVLESGYTLKHYNPATYSNANVTSKLQLLQPTVWSGFNWGPDQAHPDDANNGLSSFTLANAGFILRDRTKNNGSTVNTSASYTLGPLEAVIWQIS